MFGTSLELADAMALAAGSKKAHDVVRMKMENLTIETDYFVIASANTVKQTRAIADAIEEKLAEAGVFCLRREGDREGEWILMDYGDCVAHIFTQNSRDYYALEDLWSDAEIVPYED